MPALNKIPKEKLIEIEKFVQEMKNKVPVVSDGENLVDLVEKKFGIRLSPNQIYKLQRGIKTYRISLPMHVAEKLKREYGSVGEGIKKIAKIYSGLSPDIPEHLREPYEILLKKKVVKISEVEDVLKDFDDPWGIIKELARLGLVYRDKDEFVISRFKRDPILEFFLFRNF